MAADSNPEISRTSKKVAVFLYTPSVGGGNPADWDFIIFVEKE